MNLSKAQVRKQISWTNKCFLKALREHYDMKLTRRSRRMQLHDLKQVLIDKELPINTPEIHAIYMKHVLNLESKKLSAIVAAFEQGKQSRHPDTIAAITYELFERAVSSESKEQHE